VTFTRKVKTHLVTGKHLLEQDHWAQSSVVVHFPDTLTFYR